MVVALAVAGAWVLAFLLVVAPWVVILADALFLGFHFELSLAMLLVFSLGLLLLASAGTEA